MKVFLKNTFLLLLIACMSLHIFAGCKEKGSDLESDNGTGIKQVTSGNKSASPEKSIVKDNKSTTTNRNTTTIENNSAENNATEKTGNKNQKDDVPATDISRSDVLVDILPDNNVNTDNLTSREEKQLDLGGRTIIVSFHEQSRIPNDKAKEGTPGRFIWDNAKKTEQKYNFKFQFETSPAYNETIKINALAGTEYRDVIFAIEPWIMPALVDAGYFLSLENYVSTDDPIWKTLIQTCTSWKGKHYGITIVGALYGGQNHVYYYEPIMQREAIDIWKYVDEKDWTWDTFLEVAKQTTRDTNGDGITDQWGILSMPQNLGDSLLYSNGGRYMEPSEGTYKIALDSPQAIKALTFMSDLYNVHKVTKKITSIKEIQELKGRVAMTLHGIADVYTSPALGEGIYVAPLPIGYDMEQFITGYRTQHEMFVFPSNIKDGQKVIDVFASWFYENYLSYNASGSALRGNAEGWYKHMDPANLDLLVKINELGTGVTTPTSVFSPITTEVKNRIFNKIIDMETPVTTAISENKSFLQSIIDQKMGK